jgi:hypothetical protein
MVDPAQEPLVHLPLLVRFALVLAIFLFIPPLCRRLRIPPGVGLLFAGVALGPSGLHTLPKPAPVASFFAEIGKLLLMFFAGLEIDLSQFRRTGARSLVFGFTGHNTATARRPKMDRSLSRILPFSTRISSRAAGLLHQAQARTLQAVRHHVRGCICERPR